MLDYLPEKIKDKLKIFNLDDLSELRLRAGKYPVAISVDGRTGKFIKRELPYITDNNDIEKIILVLSGHSYASIENQLKNGFITSRDGQRIGVGGECVIRDGKISSMKNFTSLCIRFPHRAKGCSDYFFDNYIKGQPSSCLVISPPFHGKTTFVRDLGVNFCEKLGLSVLFLDERDEFS